jgi:hypothetical protein
MKISSSMQFKAALLTFVFLLNIIVGFACAVGMDVDFNSEHHQEQETVHSSEHAHHDSDHHRHTKHEHDEKAADHHAAKSSKDNCCKDQVTKITKADKLNQAGFNYSLLAGSFFLLPAIGYQIGNPGTFPANVPNTYFVLHCRPPIPDVRIAIQSFQI